MSAARAMLRWLRAMSAPFGDPRQPVRAVAGYVRFARELGRYKRMPGAERIRWSELYPALLDRTGTSGIDPHYFHVNAWAMREVLRQRPSRHVDVASQTAFASMLSACVPVTYCDYRPLMARLEGLTSCAGSLLALPFADQSLCSLSCLHVVEHVGLGRYGDPLDPQGTARACQELARVLAPGGRLLLALPVGRARTCFNAHRVIDPSTIIGLLPDLVLERFAGVDDAGDFRLGIQPGDLTGLEYACGMYTFVREKP
jgi:SAM-dependent methyltransferase